MVSGQNSSMKKNQNKTVAWARMETPLFVELCLLMVIMYTELFKFVLRSSWKKKYMYIHKANRLKEQIIYVDNLKWPFLPLCTHQDD